MKNQFLNFAALLVFNFAGFHAFASSSVVTCIPQKTGKVAEMDELLAATRIVLQKNDAGYVLDLVSGDGKDVYVKGAKCVPSERASGLLYLIQLICVDEKKDSMPMTYNRQTQKVTLTSPWFPGGQIIGNCK